MTRPWTILQQVLHDPPQQASAIGKFVVPSDDDLAALRFHFKAKRRWVWRNPAYLWKFTTRLIWWNFRYIPPSPAQFELHPRRLSGALARFRPPILGGSERGGQLRGVQHVTER